MIIYRYLSRQLFASTMAVAFVLVLVLVFGRFIKYLADAAEGKLEASALFALLAFRLPGFLELILPLALFLGVLLSYGRMYVDSEMTVLRACGLSNTQLLRLTLVPALSMVLVVGSFSLFLSPWGFAKVQQVMAEQRARPQIDMLTAGRFYKRSGADRETVTYAEGLVDKRTLLENVFIAEFPLGRAQESTRPNVVRAASGRRVQDEEGNQFLELRDGFRYEGVPGQANFHVVAFETYRLRIDTSVPRNEQQLRGSPLEELVRRRDSAAIAELQWRVSLPFMCLVAILLAVPLARVEPRQGRFLKLLPSALLFLVYLALLVGVRQWVERGVLPAALGPWWVHLSFALVGVWLVFSEEMRLWWRTRGSRA